MRLIWNFFRNAEVNQASRAFTANHVVFPPPTANRLGTFNSDRKRPVSVGSIGLKANIAWVFLLLVVAWGLLADEPLGAQNQGNPDCVLATVAGTPIRRQAVWNRIPNRKKIWPQLSAAQQKTLEQAALEAIVQQQVVMAYLKKYQRAISEGELDLQLDALKAELAAVEQSLDSYLLNQKMNREELRRKIIFQESWKRYLKEQLSDENLRLHFNKNRRKFDGTDVRVAHVVLLRKPDATEEALEQQALEIYQQLQEKKLSWEQAVAKFSQGTQASQGELGWMLSTPTMPPAFVAAARPLRVGDVSKPVSTAFGVHLIRCLEVKAGKLDFGDARQRVREDAKRFLFEAIVNRHRDNVEVEFTTE